jgi:hypothetical protein
MSKKNTSESEKKKNNEVEKEYKVKGEDHGFEFTKYSSVQKMMLKEFIIRQKLVKSFTKDLLKLSRGIINNSWCKGKARLYDRIKKSVYTTCVIDWKIPPYERIVRRVKRMLIVVAERTKDRGFELENKDFTVTIWKESERYKAKVVMKGEDNSVLTIDIDTLILMPIIAKLDMSNSSIHINCN